MLTHEKIGILESLWPADKKAPQEIFFGENPICSKILEKEKKARNPKSFWVFFLTIWKWNSILFLHPFSKTKDLSVQINRAVRIFMPSLCHSHEHLKIQIQWCVYHKLEKKRRSKKSYDNSQLLAHSYTMVACFPMATCV